jgi:hypothetical protein
MSLKKLGSYLRVNLLGPDPRLMKNISLMYELKQIGKVFTSKSVGTGPPSYEKRIYQAAVSQGFEKHWFKQTNRH